MISLPETTNRKCFSQNKLNGIRNRDDELSNFNLVIVIKAIFTLTVRDHLFRKKTVCVCYSTGAKSADKSTNLSFSFSKYVAFIVLRFFSISLTLLEASSNF